MALKYNLNERGILSRAAKTYICRYFKLKIGKWLRNVPSSVSLDCYKEMSCCYGVDLKADQFKL